MSRFSPLRLPYCSLIPPFIVSKNPWRGWSPRIFHWALVPHQNKWYGWLRTDEQMCFFHWFLQVPDVFCFFSGYSLGMATEHMGYRHVSPCIAGIGINGTIPGWSRLVNHRRVRRSGPDSRSTARLFRLRRLEPKRAKKWVCWMTN